MLSVFLLSVTCKPFMLSVVMMSVVMHNVVMLSVMAPGASIYESVVPMLATKQHSFAGLLPRKKLVKFLKFSPLVGKLVNS